MRLWIAVALVAVASPAWAGKREADDLRRQIEMYRSGAGDLERLDERRSVGDELALLRAWIDDALARHQKSKFDKVREVLERCAAQSELIRQKIAASKLTAEAVEREDALARSRDKVERTRTAIEQAAANKKALEATTK